MTNQSVGEPFGVSFDRETHPAPLVSLCLHCRTSFDRRGALCIESARVFRGERAHRPNPLSSRARRCGRILIARLAATRSSPRSVSLGATPMKVALLVWTPGGLIVISFVLSPVV